MAELYMRYIVVVHPCGCVTVEIGATWYLTAQNCITGHRGVCHVGSYKPNQIVAG